MYLIVFLMIFAAIALLLIAFAAATDKESKRTLSRLDAIRLGQSGAADEPLIVRRRQDVLSAIPWLDELLQRLDIAARVRLMLYQADTTWTAGRLLLTSVLAAVVCAYLVGQRTGSYLLAFCFMIFGGMSPLLYILRKRRQRFDLFKQRLPEALDLMVSAIRAGHGFSSAMGMAARESLEPIKREFRQCYDEQNFGLDLRVAMGNLAHRVPTRDIRMISTAILIQKETGGNLAEVLDKCATVIRERFRLKNEIRIKTAQGRLTGWILSILPLVLGILLFLVNPKGVSLLWQRPMGLKMLQGALVMTIIGGLIIRKIVRIRV